MLRREANPAQALTSQFPVVGTMTGESTEQSDGSEDVNTLEKAEQRFDRILREYGPALARLSFAYERVAPAREELAQEIALAIWQALPRFREECSERTFVYRIAHNCGMTHVWRRRPAHPSLEEMPDLQPVDPTPHLEEQLSRKRQSEHLREAVGRLPLHHRQVVLLMLEDLTLAEIGEVLGISENNVAVRMNRARKALRADLEGRP